MNQPENMTERPANGLKSHHEPDDIRLALEMREYKRAEELTVQVLQGNRLAAQIWVYLGEALLHQGCGDAASRAFERAWLLDPQAQWVEAAHKALSGLQRGPVRRSVDALLDVKPVTVAAAVMARNEARCIERCVQSLIHAVDEIVIIDSGSTDGTVELVEHLPKVRVIRNMQLHDDFAGKRNSGLAHLQSDWVLWVDADEWLFEEDVQAVREAASLFHESTEPTVLNICQVNYIADRESRDYSLPRMFPLHRDLHYYGRVHEQVVIQGQDMYAGGISRQAVRIRLHHDGYEPGIMQHKQKLARNLKLLQKAVEEEPGNPGWLLFYGRETLGSGDTDKALELFVEAERAAQDTPNFGRLSEVLMFMNRIYMSRKDYDSAEAVCMRAIQADSQFPDARYHLAQAQMRKAVALLQAAEQNLKQSKAGFQTYRGNVTADASILDWRADLSLADLAALTGKTAEAKARYGKIARRHPELEKVKRKLARME
ncbi:tetratricopeptide repeat-containing glycosyltransferase family 2 protein [Paenibacillus nasutitermitis]|uniref:Glycosyltransferase 2-like domain-containing protein n=1 Tax=Paenibacillus nasutitermitis TaxID=1652958 RepID=A0A917E1V7_9BACL|nr:glycosyltransferase family 2 protein [Paenibacillus nasutitermitis]GGD94148.1 hypothetical protein GCM10010911_61050 [Paenibacillus nasutitermitis]